MIRCTYLGAELVEWRVGRSTFTVIPAAGARLLGWTHAGPDGSPREVLHRPEAADLAALALAWGGNPILFPFAGRCFVAGEPLRWRDPSGVIRPMPNHGIARQGRFRVLETDATGFAARLEPDRAAQECYPFLYDFTVRYRFASEHLVCTLALANRDRVPIPWSSGHHFYFKVPWNRDAPRSSHFVRVSGRRRLTLDPQGLLQPVADFPDAAAVGGTAAGGISHLELESPVAELARQHSPEVVRVRFEAPELDPAMTFVTWTPAADAPFYCIEPWLGPPNAPGNGLGVRWVQPGAESVFTVTVELA